MDDTIHRSYEGFAYVYDTFMDNVPYEEWAEYVTGILEEYGITDGLVLDLGCGTGSMTELLAEKGYDMIGVDLSADMLEIAMDKRSRKGLDRISSILQQDMREFELYGTVRAIVCICDSIELSGVRGGSSGGSASGQQLSGSRRNLRVRSEHTLQIPGDPRRFRDRGEPGGVQLYLGKHLSTRKME